MILWHIIDSAEVLQHKDFLSFRVSIPVFPRYSCHAMEVNVLKRSIPPVGPVFTCKIAPHVEDSFLDMGFRRIKKWLCAWEQL